MKIHILVGDTIAKQLVMRVLGSPIASSGDDTALTYEYNVGGPESVAVFSLQSETMFYAHGTARSLHVSAVSKRATMSMYTAADIARGAKLAAEQLSDSAKDWNKHMRVVLTPEVLKQRARTFLALNASVDVAALDSQAVLGQLVAASKLALDPKHEGRGGHVIYSRLPNWRVISNTADAATMQEIKRMPLRYGCSNIAFTSDVIRTLKTAYMLGLNMSFDTDGSQLFANYVAQTLLPSAKMFGAIPANGIQLPVSPSTATGNDFVVTTAWIKATFKLLRLKEVMPLAVTLAYDSPTTDVWYRRALAKVIDTFCAHLGIYVPYELTRSEEIVRVYKGHSLTLLARMLQRDAGHAVALLNSPKGSRITTDTLPADADTTTFGAMLRKGYKPAGALVYYAWYNQSAKNPFVAFMDDKDYGLVHMLAQPFMASGNLWAVPCGLLGMYPKAFDGSVAHTSIDPWVFLELMARLGDAAPNVIKAIWESIEVPLRPERIGYRTYVLCSATGVDVLKNLPGQHLT